MSAALDGESDACPAASAGASLRPSPIMRTRRPAAFNSSRRAILSAGSAAARHTAIPACCATSATTVFAITREQLDVETGGTQPAERPPPRRAAACPRTGTSSRRRPRCDTRRRRAHLLVRSAPHQFADPSRSTPSGPTHSRPKPDDFADVGCWMHRQAGGCCRTAHGARVGVAAARCDRRRARQDFGGDLDTLGHPLHQFGLAECQACRSCRRRPCRSPPDARGRRAP